MTGGGDLVLRKFYCYWVVRTPPSAKPDDGAFFHVIAVGGFWVWGGMGGSASVSCRRLLGVFRFFVGWSMGVWVCLIFE